jgi:peptidoglycan/LPS O-acetylase OafA/YrhL
MASMFSAGPLVSERVAATRGRSSGFDYLRFWLSIGVILFHTVVTCYGPAVQKQVNQSWLGAWLALILPMFFSLSGFLVAGSLMRSRSIGVYLGLRALRIFPALAVETLFCALVLGLAYTTLSPGDYLGHPDFRASLLNAFGWIHYTLPGVFESNPVAYVDAQLWTIPIELQCYIGLGVLALFGCHRRRWLLLALSALLMGVLELRVLFLGAEPWSGRLLALCFLSGVCAFLYRDRLRLSGVACVLALLASLVMLATPKLLYLAALPVTYVTVWLGLLNPVKSKWMASGDYSYGLFLYGFPLQQALVASLPLAREWYTNAALAIPLALLFAVLSWHGVEKHALACKHLLFRAHAAWSGRMRGATGP